MSSAILIGVVKDTNVIERKTAKGNLNYFQTVLVEMDDERKKIDIRLPSSTPMQPGAYEIDLLSIIDVQESYGQRRLTIRDFASPELRLVGSSSSSANAKPLFTPAVRPSV